MADPRPLPDWYTPEGTAPLAAARNLPDWYAPEPAPQAAPAEDTSAIPAYLSDVGKVPSAVASTPRFLLHDIPEWLKKQGLGDRKNDATDPLVNAVSKLPSAENVNDAIGLTPHLVDHTSLLGRLSGAGITGALSGGILNPRSWLSMLKAGASTVAAEGAHEVAPDNLGLQLAAAAAAHSGLSFGGKATGAAYDAFGKPYLQPTKAGTELAGAVVGHPSVENSFLPGLANPSNTDLTGAADATRAATDSLGPGAFPPAVMGGYRDFLDTLKGHLESARNAGSAPFYNAFRSEPLMTPPAALTDAERATRWPLGLPAVAPAMGRAATNMMNDRGGQRAANNPYGGPVADVNWTDFNPAGDPVYKTTPMPTPDLLDRTKRQLNIGATQAGMKADTDTAASKTNAAAQMTDFLKKQYPDTYPQALDAYAKGSVPLTPFEHPDVASTLQRNESATAKDLGPVKGDAELLNHIGASASPGETVQAFINAVGDKKAAIQPLQDAIVGHLRETPGVIDPTTGEVNAKALDQATRKYMPTISMYFPELKQKFGTAKAAQATLDNMRVQEGIATGVRNGALRDSSGTITPKSFDKWIGDNAKSIDPAALIRLKQIGAALKEKPFGGAEAATDALPAAAGVAMGGGEGGIVGSVTGKVFTGPRDALLAKARDAYSKAIERAATDPAYADSLGRAVGARGKGVSGWKALTDAITNAPVSANAAKGR